LILTDFICTLKHCCCDSMQKLSVCLALSGASGFVLPSPQLRLQRRALEAEGVGPLRRQRLYPPSALRSDAGRTVEENSEGAAERAHLEAMMDSADLSKHLEDELKGMPMEEKKMLKSIGLDLPDVETAADHDGQFVFDPSLLDKPLEELEEMIEESSKSRAAMEEMEVFAKKMKEAGGGGKAKKSERDMEDEEKEEKLQSEAIEKLLRSRGLDMDQMSSSIDDFFREAEVQSSSGRPKETAPETPPTPSPSAEKREGRIEETVGDLIIVEDPEPKGAVFGIGKRKGKKGKLRKLGEGEGEGQGKTSSEKGELELGKENFSDVGKGLGKKSFTDVGKGVGKESFSDVGKGIGKESFSDVGKGIGKESFSDFEKEVGKESFSDVGQGIGKESFSDVGKEVGKESFTDVGKALGIESFVEAKAQEGGRRKSLFKPPVSPSSSASAETEGEVDASEASPASSSPSPSTASSSSGRRRRRGFGSAVEVEGTEGKEKGQSEKERASQRKLSEKIPSLEGGLLPPSAVKRAASLEGGLVFPSGGSKEKKETKFSEKKEGEEGEKKTSKERENPKDLREAVKEFQKKKDEMEAKAGKKMDPATQLQLAIDTGLVERRDPERERMIRERMKKRLRKERLEKASIEPMEVMEQLGQPQTQGMKEELEMLEEMELEMEDQARAIRKRKLQKEGKIDVELEQDKVFGEYDEEDLDQIERSLEKAKARRDQRQNEGDADDNTLATEAYIDFSPLPEAKLEEIDFSMMTDDELSAFQSIAAVEFGKPVEIGRRMAGGKTMKLPSEIAVEYCQLADPFTSLVDFERFIQYSEYQEALKDGQLTMEDLKEAWDAVEKVKKNRVDLKGFKLAWKYIDGLFEDAEEEGDAGEEEEESAEEKAVSEDAAGEAEEEEDGDQWEEVEVEEDEDEDAEEEEADLNFLKSRTEQRIANLLRVADSSGRIPGDYPGDTYILGELISDEWQMDLYSRSVRVGGPKGKKLWELLITDQTGNFRHIEQIDGRQVNSRTVCEAIIRVMQRSPVKPVLVRFFRDQMQTMLTIAIEGAELRVRASRSCWTLNDWLKEREDKVYPKMEGYDPTLKTLYTPFVFPPDPAPKDMKVAAYGLGMLQLKELLALANQVDNFIGCQLPPQLDTKDGDVSIPGIVFYTGYKTTQFSQAMLSREIAFVKANLADRAIRIEANIYTTYDMAGIADKTLPYAARFENGKLAAQGLHYVAVAASAVERPVSLWLLRETALEEIALRRGVREELETGMMTELDTEATKEASVL